MTPFVDVDGALSLLRLSVPVHIALRRQVAFVDIGVDVDAFTKVGVLGVAFVFLVVVVFVVVAVVVAVVLIVTELTSLPLRHSSLCMTSSDLRCPLLS